MICYCFQIQILFYYQNLCYYIFFKLFSKYILIKYLYNLYRNIKSLITYSIDKIQTNYYYILFNLLLVYISVNITSH